MMLPVRSGCLIVTVHDCLFAFAFALLTFADAAAAFLARTFPAFHDQLQFFIVHAIFMASMIARLDPAGARRDKIQ